MKKEEKINKNRENILRRDSNGLYMSPLFKDNMFDVENKRITNVISPLLPEDAVNRKYVDNQNFFATIQSNNHVYSLLDFQTIVFDKYTNSDIILVEN